MPGLDALVEWFDSMSGWQFLGLGLSAVLLAVIWNLLRPGKRIRPEPEMPEGAGRLYEKVPGNRGPEEIHPQQGQVHKSSHIAILRPSEPGLKLFAKGQFSSVRDLVKDISVMPGALYFHYDYTTIEPKSSRNFPFTVGFYKLQGLGLPEFELAPERPGDRFLSMLGRADLNLSWYPEFSRRFRLAGPDRAAVVSLFTPDVAGSLRQIGGRWTAQGARDCVIFFRQGFLYGPAYGRFMRDAAAAFRALTNKWVNRDKSPKN